MLDLLNKAGQDTGESVDSLAASLTSNAPALQEMGFNGAVLEAVTLLTHLPQIPYEEYLEGIKKNPLAKTVKLADIAHNSDQTRLDAGDLRAERWAKKYKRALEILNSEG